MTTVVPSIVFVPTPATGEDCFCSCVICHLPRRESDGVERGNPVEWLVRMRLADCTIWQGLHTKCWERNRTPITEDPTLGLTAAEAFYRRTGAPR